MLLFPDLMTQWFVSNCNNEITDISKSLIFSLGGLFSISCPMGSNDVFGKHGHIKIVNNFGVFESNCTNVLDN